MREEPDALQRVREARDRGLREPGATRDLLVAEIAVAGAEAAQDREAARQRRDELPVAGFTHAVQGAQLGIVGRARIFVSAGHGPDYASCCASSRRPIWLLCTSSGPSTSRSVRACA